MAGNGFLINPDDERITWSTRGAELGAGEYHVSLFGPKEHTAWGMRHDRVIHAESPKAAVVEMFSTEAATLCVLPRWRITVQVGRQPADIEDQDLAILEATFNPGGIGV